MSDTLVKTLAGRCRRVYSTDSVVTGSTITAPAPVLAKGTTPPLSDGCIEMAGMDGPSTSNGLKLFFYGTDTADQTFIARAFGWELAGVTELMWVPFPLFAWSGILGSRAGLTGGIVGSSYLFADTLTIALGNAGVGGEVVSPADNSIAHAIFDTKGARYVSISLARNASSVSLNALYSRV